MNTTKITALIIVLFIAGAFVGWWGRYWYVSDRPTTQARSIVRQSSHNYKYINPLIGVEVSRKSSIPELKEIEEKTHQYIESAKKNGKALSVSVYVRDLDSGRWTGVNEDEKYAPASLFKVFLLMVYLNKSETDPSLLQKKLYYDGKVDRNEVSYYKPTTSLIKGKYYTVEELLRRTIIHSGNNSSTLLIENIGDQTIIDFLNNLDFPIPPQNTIDFMSARSYSFAFRALYNSTYLSRQLSEKALELLAQSEFDKGIVAGVPEGTGVAHKFGERWIIEDEKGPKELHDCGIVYYPGHPYFMCVMTKGINFPDLEIIIKDISKLGYEGMNAYYSKFE